MVTKEILYFTDNRLDRKPIGKAAKEWLLKGGLPILSISLKPIKFGRNIHYEGRRSHTTMFKQILTGLAAATADVIFMGEHDVLYHPSHFDFIPERDDVYYYNNNVWKYRLSDQKVIRYDCKWLSQLCAYRELLIEHYERRIAVIESGKRAYGYEPGTGANKRIDDFKAESWDSEYPNIDVRHGRNWTGVRRMDPSEFKDKRTCQNWQETTVENIPGWDVEVLLSL